jgi:hypothetical protein
MEKCKYNSTHSESRHEVEESEHLHSLAGLFPAKRAETRHFILAWVSLRARPNTVERRKVSLDLARNQTAISRYLYSVA